MGGGAPCSSQVEFGANRREGCKVRKSQTRKGCLSLIVELGLYPEDHGDPLISSKKGKHKFRVLLQKEHFGYFVENQSKGQQAQAAAV